MADKAFYSGRGLGGGMVGAAIGAGCNPDGGVAQSIREPTLDEVRSEFAHALGEVEKAHRNLSETTNPEVFAHRAYVLAVMASDLSSNAHWLRTHAFNAAKK